MATNSSVFSGSTNAKWQVLHLVFNRESQDITNNRTLFSYEAYIQGTGGGTGSTYAGSYSITGATTKSATGQTWSWTTTTKQTIATGTFYVTHNSDGTLGNQTISISVSFVTKNGTLTASTSVSLTVPTIPRASSFTLGGATRTNADINVTISRASTSFTHKVRYKVGSGSWIDVASSATTSASFKVQPSNMANLKSATITVGVQTYNGTTTIGSEATATRTITIPNSTITLSGTANTGSAQTVTISNSGGSLSYTRSWKLGSATGTNSSTWTPPHSALPSATSGTLTCTVVTKNGTATINTVSATRTITVPTSVLPTFGSITHSEYVTNVATLVGAYVQGKTRLTLGVTNPSAGSGSSIKSYSISVGGRSVSSNGGTTAVINQSGTLTITATVTDNRNRTVTKTDTITVLAYENPIVTGVSFTRSNSNGTPNTTGTHLTIKATIRVRRLVVGSTEKNKIWYQSQSAQLGSNYVTKTNLENESGSISGNYRQSVYTHTFSGYPVDYPYNVRVRGGDIFSWSGYIAGGIPTGVVLQHWGESTTSFGKMIDDINYNVLVGAKGMNVDGPLRKNGLDVMVDVDLSSQVQLTSHRYSVIALCELTNTNASFNSYSNGVLTLHRDNSLMGEVRINIGMAKKYNTTQPNVTMLSLAVNQGVVPCTFTYGGVKYGGVRIYISNAQFGDVHFYGVSNFNIFGLDYYSADGSQILNAEVNSSLNLNDHHYTGSLYFQNQIVGGSSSVSWSEVTGKPSTFAPSSHTHTWAQVTGKPAQSTRWPTWSEVTSKPSTFAPSTHTHSRSQTQLRGATTIAQGGNYSLSQSILNFDLIIIHYSTVYGTTDSYNSDTLTIYPHGHPTSGTNPFSDGYASTGRWVNWQFTSPTNLQCRTLTNTSSPRIRAVYGIKFTS